EGNWRENVPEDFNTAFFAIDYRSNWSTSAREEEDIKGSAPFFFGFARAREDAEEEEDGVDGCGDVDDFESGEVETPVGEDVQITREEYEKVDDLGEQGDT